VGGDPEVLDKARRRCFSAQYKQRIVREAEACREPGQIGALLRREGLYSSHLSAWRRQAEQGTLAALGGKRGAKARQDRRDKEIERLKRDNDRLRDQLEQAQLIIEIQKKVSEILGIPLRRPEDDESAS
jgi:transposase-like protein